MIISSPKTTWSTITKCPQISTDSYVFDSAYVIGDVTLGNHILVSPGASLRADEGNPIFVGNDSNVQDYAILHGLKNKFITVEGNNYSIYVGERVSCAHACIIHGPCWIKGDTFVGFNSVLYNCTIEKNVFIGHGTQVIGVTIPANRFVNHGQSVLTQAEADALPQIPADYRDFNDGVVATNVELAAGYLLQSKK